MTTILDLLSEYEKRATPGPWSLRDGDQMIRSEDYYHVADVRVSREHPHEGETAALIALLRNHAADLIAVARAAAAHVDMEWASFVEFGEPEHGDQPPNTSVTNTKLVAALAPLLAAAPEGAA